MNVYVAELIERYQNAGVLIDTNLLLLYFVGVYDRTLIPRFKRTDKFAVEDFATLHQFIMQFKVIATLPYILAEVSNFLGQLTDRDKRACFEGFAVGIGMLEEPQLTSARIARTDEFKRFGITDAGIYLAAKSRYLVLTDDFRLSQYLRVGGIDALNFNHLRTYFEGHS
jgi:hypothetical protein